MRSDGKEKTYSNDKVEKQNPPKYELLEDLANMTYLSEASVVYNLSERYVRFLIYTYSGKFDQSASLYILTLISLQKFNLTAILRSLLCHCQPLQVASSIWQSRCWLLQGQEKIWNASTYLLHLW